MIKHCFLILIIYLNTTFLFGQQKQTNECLFSYIDSTSGKELIGYKSINGEIPISAKYLNGPESLCKMAIVLTSEFEFIGIDKNENIILKPFIYDNGPDYIEEGLFRFVENGKMGFANENGEKIIKAKYDFVTPFSDGISEFSIGGKQIYEDGRTREQIIKENGYEALLDKHWIWAGNVLETGFINKFGQEFIKVTTLKRNKRFAWTKDSKKYILNKDGEIIKQVK